MGQSIPEARKVHSPLTGKYAPTVRDDPTLRAEMQRLRDLGYTIRDIASTLNVGRGSVHRFTSAKADLFSESDYA